MVTNTEIAENSSKEEDNDVVSEKILSRKIAIKSMTRHFAGWKIRQFNLTKSTGFLEIVSLDKDQMTLINLALPSVSIGRHYYAIDRYKWLWLKYYDKEEKCPKEVILKFEDDAHITHWEQVR